MRKMKWKLMFAWILVACVYSGINLRFAQATPGKDVTTTILSGPIVVDEIDAKSHSEDHKVHIQSKGFSDVYIVHYKIAPGGHTGWYSHPGICFVTVKSGKATEYHGDDPNNPHIYSAGSGFVEQAGDAHLVENAEDTDLELVVLHLVPLGAPRRIDEPQP